MIRSLMSSVMIAATAVLAAAVFRLPVAKITIRITDERNTNLEGIETGITFEKPGSKPGSWGASEHLTRSGKTDPSGLFSAEAEAGFIVHYGAGGDGYYKSYGQFEFKAEKEGRYLPWNPTVELIVKKIIKPIPMFARRLEKEIPVVNESVGFDLIEADWVAPHGKGKSDDLLFRVTKRVVSFHDFGAELLVSFPNNGDGIVPMSSASQGGSELRSSHEAPGSGYDPSLSLLQGNSKERGQYGIAGEPKNYFVRTRTILDERGQVVSSLYGKIYGQIEYFPVSYKSAKLRFTYYLNPTVNDRNVEFDPKRNLFTNLKSDEKVTAP